MKNTWRIGPPARSGVPGGGLAEFDGSTWADPVPRSARIRRSEGKPSIPANPVTIWLGDWSPLALSTRYGDGPNGLDVEPKPSVAIHTTSSQRCVVARGTTGAFRRLPFVGALGRRGRGPPGHPGRSTGAVSTSTG